MKISTFKLFGLFALVALLSFWAAAELNAQTGKIAGQVIDQATGEVLPGANMTIVGTTLGAATDTDGNYFIINVPPGLYSVRGNMIGFAPVVQTEVRVSVNLTTTVDFTLQVEAVELSEITIVSERPVIQRDVSANIAMVSAGEVENLPVAGVSEIIDLQAGIEPGIVIRGGGLEQVAFVVDGIAWRDGRDNVAFTTVSYTAIDELQIQTGGFNAEYGNLRSGLINVVTKDPPRNRYTADVLVRYRSTRDLNIGPGPKDANAHWMRPYLDPDVASVGTANGPWDRYTQRQYPSFDGWNLIAENLADDTDPTNDLTVEQLQEVFNYHHRKDTDINEHQYELDLTVGGPLVPGGSKALGDLRFLVSYRGTQEPYFYPQARRSFNEDLVHGKVTSNIGANKKLELKGLWGEQSGMSYQAFASVLNPNPQRGGIPNYPWGDGSGGRLQEALEADDLPPNMVNQNNDHVGRSVIFGTDRYSVTDVERWMLGASFTHTLSAKTFYQVQVSRFATDYFSRPNSRRNTTPVKTIGQSQFDEAPFGWTSNGTSSIGSGLRLGGHWARARDTSDVALWTGKFDITSQVNRFSQLKAGVELNYYDYDMNYGSDDSVIVHLERSNQRWSRKPKQGAAYVQNKLEFKGMIANVGLRLDYYDPSGNWFSFDPFDRAFTAKNKNNRDDLLEDVSTDKQLTFSPRLGVSFPISDNSKLYFNYGHFRQVLTARELFQVEQQWLGNIGNLGNPNQPFLRTVSYELGYDHNLFDLFLLRLSGYYRDNDNQSRVVRFVSIDGAVDYNIVQPLRYEDVRGFEVTLNKIRGKWFRGFVNYTFLQFKSGNFGFLEQHENTIDQRNYARTTTDHYQTKPVTQPFASFNLEFLSPLDFGPEVLGGHPLADFRLDLLGAWRAGQVFTWPGRAEGIPGLRDNIRMKDFWSLDLRLSKNIKTPLGQTQFFIDVNNILNFKQMYFDPTDPNGGPFESGTNLNDWFEYMESLHIADDTFEDIGEAPYLFIPGRDRPGDRRKDGVAFVPIEIVANAAGLPADAGFLEPDRRVLYFVHDTGTYMEFQNGALVAADRGFVNQVLDDKAYIDMPNEIHRTFLNPRSVVFGIRYSF